MSTTSQIADALEKSGIPFTRVEGVVNGIEYWGLSVRHENVHAEVRECSKWVEMKAWHYTPEQFMDMLVGAGTCHVKAVKKLGDLFGFSLSCGHSMVNPFDDRPDYCPWCGAKVMDE